MPSKSPAQARLMAAAAHSPTFAKKAGVPQSVAKDFNAADAGTGIIRPKRKKRAPSKEGAAVAAEVTKRLAAKDRR